VKTMAVLDFGGQYAHLIATRVRELGVRADIFNPEAFDPARILDLVGIIFSGGPHSVSEKDFPTVNFDVRNCPVPILGLCYGHQLLASLWGGEVTRGHRREYGATRIDIRSGASLFAGLPQQQRVWMSHGDHVSVLPEGLQATAASEDLPVAAFESIDGRSFGLQFHPEVMHTEHGQKILDNFISICTSERPWQPEAYHRQIIEQIKAAAQNRKLLLLLSGGVDSLVALKLCLEAVGPQRVFSLHVDTGMMRAGESEEIIRHLADEGFTGIRLINAETSFLSELIGVEDPEAKRRIIGRLFVKVVEDELESLQLDENWSLVQGTIYPDHIESGGSDKAQTIKTHHNRVAEIESLIAAGRVIEPLRDLYKDEVRRLGLCIGLPPALINRHPFPGPGLGIRILCSNAAPLPQGWDSEQARLFELIEPYGLEGIILPLRSVGVQGDSRSYLHPAAIWPKSGRSVSWEQMTAAARLVVNTLHTVNRVVWSSRPLPEGLQLEAEFVSRSRLDRLREVDAAVREKTAHLSEIWQMPVVSLPARTRQGGDVFVIRPITSRDAMTADAYKLEPDSHKALYDDLLDRLKVGAVLYDLTSKPPGTIEWE